MDNSDPSEPFVLGPLYLDYWMRVAALGSNPLRLAMPIKYWAGYRRPRGRTNGVRIGLGDLGALGLDHRAARRALGALELAGLATVERSPGCKPVVTLTEKCSGLALYSVPWKWWYAASPLSGSALVVGLAILFRTGRSSVEFNLSGLEIVGLTRWTASRGLSALEEAGLVAVEWRSGSSPIVTLLI